MSEIQFHAKNASQDITSIMVASSWEKVKLLPPKRKVTNSQSSQVCQTIPIFAGQFRFFTRYVLKTNSQDWHVWNRPTNGRVRVRIELWDPACDRFHSN